MHSIISTLVGILIPQSKYNWQWKHHTDKLFCAKSFSCRNITIVSVISWTQKHKPAKTCQVYFEVTYPVLVQILLLNFCWSLPQTRGHVLEDFLSIWCIFDNIFDNIQSSSCISLYDIFMILYDFFCMIFMISCIIKRTLCLCYFTFRIILSGKAKFHKHLSQEFTSTELDKE